MRLPAGLKLAVMNHSLSLLTHSSRSIPDQGTWVTTLQPRDLDDDGTPEAYYDTELNITWLRDANANGLKNWKDAKEWAANLDVHGTRGWRLPTVVDPEAVDYSFAYAGTDCGYNMRTKDAGVVYSEMAHLFYVTLGNLGYYDTSGKPRDPAVVGVTNAGPFRRMQGFMYWLDREWAWPGCSWFFCNDNGFQIYADVHYELFAMAVHPGDVGTPLSAGIDRARPKARIERPS